MSVDPQDSSLPYDSVHEPIKKPRSPKERLGASRRKFLGRVGLFTASTAVAGVVAPSLFKNQENAAQAEPISKFTGNDFPARAYQVRIKAAERLKQRITNHPTNGYEEKYPNKIASDSRGLPHNQLGEVDLKAYPE
jgi:hypothetical protein